MIESEREYRRETDGSTIYCELKIVDLGSGKLEIEEMNTETGIFLAIDHGKKRPLSSIERSVDSEE
jgi:hypothetical protein